MTQEKIYVWDRFIRFFHWNLLAGMILGYATAENDFIQLHSYIGYYLSVLLAIRVIWGFIGGPFARWKVFRFPLKTVPEYILSLLRPKSSKHYQAHNPASAYMAIALMSVMALLIASGVTALGYIEYEGPLVGFTSTLPNGLRSLLLDVHEMFFDIIFLLIVFHVLGAITSSLVHKENLIKSMIFGYRKKVSS